MFRHKPAGNGETLVLSAVWIHAADPMKAWYRKQTRDPVSGATQCVNGQFRFSVA